MSGKADRLVNAMLNGLGMTTKTDAAAVFGARKNGFVTPGDTAGLATRFFHKLPEEGLPFLEDCPISLVLKSTFRGNGSSVASTWEEAMHRSFECTDRASVLCRPVGPCVETMTDAEPFALDYSPPCQATLGVD